MKSGNLNFLESSGPLQACNGTDLPFYLYINIPYNWHDFYKESTFITDSDHPHNILDALQPVQKCFKLKKKLNVVERQGMIWK